MPELSPPAYLGVALAVIVVAVIARHLLRRRHHRQQSRTHAGNVGRGRHTLEAANSNGDQAEAPASTATRPVLSSRRRGTREATA